ncbi:cytochrome P450 [Nocardia acidivorans]|uniref:cytochrome P450 n=1 Tax=Nocardia acidivorans TaxID=404580 RepID=UPI00082CDC02|nr:cytochrome P450 [Nocardia acidivorans]
MTAVESMPRFPFAPTILGEPPAEFAQLREGMRLRKVLLPTGDTAWLATRYADVRQVLTDGRLSRAAATAEVAPRLGPMRPNPKSLMAMDPPDHTRLRRILAPMFSRAHSEQQRDRIVALVDELLSAMLAAGAPGELDAGLSRPLALTVICDLLGVPDGDRRAFADWTDQALTLRPDAGADVGHARRALRDYLEALAAGGSHDGLMGTLTESLAGEELTEVAATILTAGYHTVSTAITNSALVLLRHPDQLAALRADRTRLPEAVEELLRYTPGPVSGGTIRVAVADLHIGDTLVRAGEAVIPATISANRDQTVFTAPDRLDLSRKPNGHIAFGAGVHHCLGMHLARVELSAAIAGLLDRFPGLALAAPPERLAWRNGAMIGGLERLPIQW